MSNNVEPVDFPFAAARRITSEEVAAAKLAVKEQFGIEPGKCDRPPKPGDSELKLSGVADIRYEKLNLQI